MTIFGSERRKKTEDEVISNGSTNSSKYHASGEDPESVTVPLFSTSTISESDIFPDS